MGLERIWILILLQAVFVLIYLWRKKSFLEFPSVAAVPKDFWGETFILSFRIFSLLLLLFLLSLATGLQVPLREPAQYGYGADIIFVLDESGSMGDAYGGPLPLGSQSATPGTPNVFAAAKSLISKFAEGRKNGRDRYGLTVFGTSAIRVLPLTFNRDLFLRCVDAQEVVLESTMIFQVMAITLEELSHSTARSRVIIFVSDGMGLLSDEKYGFGDFVIKQGIRFYWIDLGQETGQGTEQETAEEMAGFIDKIGLLGRRLEASNPSKLESGLAEIDKLERSPIMIASSGSAFSSTPLGYAAFITIALLWSVYSFFVYRRRS